MISQDDDLRKHFKCLPLSMLAFFDVVFVVGFFPICFWFFFVFVLLCCLPLGQCFLCFCSVTFDI